MGYQKVSEDNISAPGTGAFKSYAKFKTAGPVLDVRIKESVEITEDGTAGLATPGIYHAVTSVKVTVGGTEYPLFYGGARQCAGSAAVAEAFMKGALEDLSRFLLNQTQGPHRHGSTDGKGITKSSSSAVWGPSLLVPLGLNDPTLFNKDIVIEIQHPTAANWEGGTTHVTLANWRTFAYANFVDKCDAFAFAADRIESIGASTEKSVQVPDKKGYYLSAVIATCIRSTTGVDDLTAMKVKKGDIVISEMIDDEMRAFIAGKSACHVSLIGQSASTAYAYYASNDGQYFPKNMGTYTLPCKPTEAVGLMAWVNTNASASATAIDFLFVYTRMGAPVQETTNQQSESSSTSSQQGTQMQPGAPTIRRRSAGVT